MRINNDTFFIKEFHLAGINKGSDLYESDGKLKSFSQWSQNNVPKKCISNGRNSLMQFLLIGNNP